MEAEDLKNKNYLLYLLRHGVENWRLEISPDGYVSVSSILNIYQTKHYYKLSIDIIKELLIKMENFTKKEMELKQKENGEYFIRATYSHSIPAVDYDSMDHMQLIVDPLPLVIQHMAKHKWLKQNVESKGISDACKSLWLHYPNDGFYEEKRMNYVVIEIDMESAMKDGIKFYRIEGEKFILTRGINNFIPLKYFAKVIHFNVEDDA